MQCKEYAKFRRSRAIASLVGLVDRAFVGPKFFLVGILWVQNFFSWIFCGSKIFSRGYFVGPKFFLGGITWIQLYSRGYIVGPKIFLVGV